MDPRERYYFAPVKLKYSIVLKLFLIFFFFALFAVLITSVFIMWVPQSMHLFALITFIFVPALIISTLLAQHLSRPIKDLMMGLDQISQNKLDFNIETDRKDEFGNLILLFNETAKKLKEVQDRNSEVGSMKSSFVTITAHQLRTPATGIRWAIETLKSAKNLTPDQQMVLEQSYDAINQITGIINDFLDLAKIEAEDLNYIFQKADLGKIIDMAVKDVTLRATGKQVNIVYDSNLAAGIEIVADSTRLVEVLSALLDNAISYSQNGSQVQIIVERRPGSVVVSIKDHGIGIPDAEKPKIFSQFYRAANAVAHRPNGSGIGLYVSKRTIEQHHGKMWFESKEGEGSTFNVELPVQKGLEPVTAKVESAIESL